MARPNPKSYLGGDLIIASGSVCVPAGQFVDVIPLPAGLAPLRFRFRFDTVEGAPPQIGTDGTKPPLIEIKLINLDNAMGQSTSTPLIVGEIGARALALSLAVHSIGPPLTRMQLLAYTFTVAGSADV